MYKRQFGEDALLTNLRALVGELERVKPAASKGKYVKKVVISTAMGPGIRIEPSAIGTTEA